MSNYTPLAQQRRSCEICGGEFAPTGYNQRRHSACRAQCSADGCDHPVQARGRCSTHYSAWQRSQPGHRRNRKKEATRRRARLVAELGEAGYRQKAAMEKRRSRGTGLDAPYFPVGRRPKKRKCRDLVGPVERRISPLPDRHPVRLLAAQSPPEKPWWAVLVQGSCAWCDESFVQGTTVLDSLPKYCSKLCGKSAAKAARGRFLISPTKRLEIYERDGWLCQLTEICPYPDQPIDPDLLSDKWAPTLDHIIPQSHVLIPDHSPENLQLAHLWCNSKKGDLRVPLAV